MSQVEIKLGFIINPIAGMGGRVGLKGTDNVVARARALGAKPEAHLRATETLSLLMQRIQSNPPSRALRWLTCSGEMGARCLEHSGFHQFEVVHECAARPSADDTATASAEFMRRGVDLVLFCGGDGTARDICRVIDCQIPLLGIPGGVKMYSGVFGVSPRRTAEIVYRFVTDGLELREADVMDLDEDRYRRGEWVVRLYDQAHTPYEASFTQSAKVLVAEGTDKEIKEEIAAYLMQEMAREPATLWILGAGSTLAALGKQLGIQKSLLGIDAVCNGRLVQSDLNEKRLLTLLSEYPEAKLVLSPIGAQGFVLGRGNSPLSPTVLRRIGVRHLIVVATPAKLAQTPLLRFDTGDQEIDNRLVGPGYLPVTVGYGRRRMVKAQN